MTSPEVSSEFVDVDVPTPRPNSTSCDAHNEWEVLDKPCPSPQQQRRLDCLQAAFDDFYAKHRPCSKPQLQPQQQDAEETFDAGGDEEEEDGSPPLDVPPHQRPNDATKLPTSSTTATASCAAHGNSNSSGFGHGASARGALPDNGSGLEQRRTEATACS